MLPLVSQILALEPDHLMLLVLWTSALTLLAVVCLIGYFMYLRKQAAPAYASANEAHQEILRVLRGTEQFQTLQQALISIDKTLNHISIQGPERVILLLAEIRQEVGKCLTVVERLQNLAEKEKPQR